MRRKHSFGMFLDVFCDAFSTRGWTCIVNTGVSSLSLYISSSQSKPAKNTGICFFPTIQNVKQNAMFWSNFPHFFSSCSSPPQAKADLLLMPPERYAFCTYQCGRICHTFIPRCHAAVATPRSLLLASALVSRQFRNPQRLNVDMETTTTGDCRMITAWKPQTHLFLRAASCLIGPQYFQSPDSVKLLYAGLRLKLFFIFFSQLRWENRMMNKEGGHYHQRIGHVGPFSSIQVIASTVAWFLFHV